MIDVSLCPNPWVKKGANRAYNILLDWLKTIATVPASQDASGGTLKAALTSSTPLYATSYNYTVADATIYCLNVMVDRKDYRLVIGFDDKVVRIEALDARAARAETKKELDAWAQNAQSAAAMNAADGNGGVMPTANDYGMTPANVPSSSSPAPASGPYGVRVPAGPAESPYGVRIPAP